MDVLNEIFITAASQLPGMILVYIIAYRDGKKAGHLECD